MRIREPAVDRVISMAGAPDPRTATYSSSAMSGASGWETRPAVHRRTWAASRGSPLNALRHVWPDSGMPVPHVFRIRVVPIRIQIVAGIGAGQVGGDSMCIQIDVISEEEAP